MSIERKINFLKNYFMIQANAQILRLGTKAARLKLKGIDGDQTKQWSMWFNPIIRVKPYQFQCVFKNIQYYNYQFCNNFNYCFKQNTVRCCMAVVSPCREMSGQIRQRTQPLNQIKFQLKDNVRLQEGEDDDKPLWPL
eukprot:TRINITY_DN284_c1_g3_i1.p10 TRINITY_DN284_c1_g3~~TRINITY_DN284_c1_g3_i1.p10  ORF type:complete len:138 (-),score=1.24 TRINITY_DN284_c1_g3_i1:387-800(-)